MIEIRITGNAQEVRDEMLNLLNQGEKAPKVEEILKGNTVPPKVEEILKEGPQPPEVEEQAATEESTPSTSGAEEEQAATKVTGVNLMPQILELVVKHQKKHKAKVTNWFQDTGAPNVSEIPKELQQEFLDKLEALK